MLNILARYTDAQLGLQRPNRAPLSGNSETHQHRSGHACIEDPYTWWYICTKSNLGHGIKPFMLNIACYIDEKLNKLCHSATKWKTT